MRTTITDIAKATGFSIATVSMILSGKDRRISESTREKVLAAAKEMNYRPNQAAVKLKLGKSQTIGVIIPDISNSYYASMVKGLEDSCSRRGYSLILCNSQDNWDKELDCISTLDSKGIDGLVLCPSANASNEKLQITIDKLKEIGVPLIQTALLPKDSEGSCVTVDSYLGGRLAAEHLCKLGHKDVAIITGPMYLKPAKDRVQGFMDVMEKYGHPVPEESIISGDYSYECGLRVAHDVLNTGCTAVFASNDMVALGLIHALRREGLRIPEDISVVGYDNILASGIAEVALTTISQPVFELGASLGTLLCDMIENKVEDPRRIIFEPTLVVRESTGPVPEH